MDRKKYKNLEEFKRDFPCVTQNQIDAAQFIIDRCEVCPVITAFDWGPEDDDVCTINIDLIWNAMEEYTGFAGRYLCFSIRSFSDEISVEYGFNECSGVGGECSVEEAVALYNTHHKQIALANRNSYCPFDFLSDKEQNIFWKLSDLFPTLNGKKTYCAEYIYACCDIKPTVAVEAYNLAPLDSDNFNTHIVLIWDFPFGEKIKVSCVGDKHVCVDFDFKNIFGKSKLLDVCANTLPNWFDESFEDFRYTRDKIDFISFFKQVVEPYAIKCKEIDDTVENLEDWCCNCETEFPDDFDIQYIYHNVNRYPNEAYPFYYKYFKMVWKQDDTEIHVIYGSDKRFDVYINGKEMLCARVKDIVEIVNSHIPKKECEKE